MEYKVLSDHAEDLADGRMVGPGETIKLSKEDIEDPHNKRLIDEGLLLEISDATKYEGGVKPKTGKEE